MCSVLTLRTFACLLHVTKYSDFCRDVLDFITNLGETNLFKDGTTLVAVSFIFSNIAGKLSNRQIFKKFFSGLLIGCASMAFNIYGYWFSRFSISLDFSFIKKREQSIAPTAAGSVARDAISSVPPWNSRTL